LLITVNKENSRINVSFAINIVVQDKGNRLFTANFHLEQGYTSMRKHQIE